MFMLHQEKQIHIGNCQFVEREVMDFGVICYNLAVSKD